MVPHTLNVICTLICPGWRSGYLNSVTSPATNPTPVFGNIQPASRVDMVLHTLNVTCTLIAILLVLVCPSLSAYEFSPRQVLYSMDLRTLFFAPWIYGGSFYALLSRLTQAGIVLRSHNLVVAHAYAFWFAVAGVRVVNGYLLTRAVGWAYPRFFSHSSLYETSSGLGPSLIALLVVTGVRGWPELPRSRVNFGEPLILGGICGVLTWLDEAPWTYAVAILLAIPVAFLRVFPRLKKGALLVAPVTGHQTPERPFSGITVSVLACLVAIVVPRLAPTTVHDVAFPSYSDILLDILVLSYPRPHDNPESSILNTTLLSFIPLTRDPAVTLSVFTHAETHSSFALARAHFTEVEFYVDRDQHPDAISGQHLHVAEALRWASTRKAEWVMLLEDDFPLCGVWGRDSLARVMHELERGRHLDYLERRGAFVGTFGGNTGA